MDKFVVKMDRDRASTSCGKPQSKPAKGAKLRQGRIDRMPTVVGVERLCAARDLLRSTSAGDGDGAAKAAELRWLLDKRPAQELLLRTEIGRAVKQCAQSDQCGEVKALAAQVMRAWSAHVRRCAERRRLPPVDVQCDPRGDKSRRDARRMLATAISAPLAAARPSAPAAAANDIFTADTDSERSQDGADGAPAVGAAGVVEALERHAFFHQGNKKVSAAYWHTIRRLANALKTDEARRAAARCPTDRNSLRQLFATILK